MKTDFQSSFSVVTRLFWAVLLITFTVQIDAHFTKGEGTQENPWRISNSPELDNVRNYLGSDHSDKYFRQEADIDMKTYNSPDGRGWIPIGTEETPFFGNYDGNGKVILNLTISRSDSSNVGLFGVVENADISKLGLRDVRIKGGSVTGALIGTMRSPSQVEQCYVTGYVSGVDAVGGLVGFVEGREVSKVADCYSTAVVQNRGTNFQDLNFMMLMRLRTRIPVNIHHTGVSSQRISYNGTGGLIGFMQRCELHRCFVAGPVLFDYENQKNTADPLVLTRISQSHTYNSYWNTDLTDLSVNTRQRSNILGRNSNQLMKSETFEGFDFDEIWSIDEDKSFPYLKWEGKSAKSHNLPPLMPPAGISATVRDRTVKLSWEIKNDLLGVPDGFNIYRNERRINETPVTSYDYTDESLELWNIYTYYITALYEGKESAAAEIFSVAPVRFGGGSGTKRDPYLIKTREHLNGVRFSLGSHYLQTADICLQDFEWIPIGSFGMAFSGSYNGNNHYISNMRISNISNAGLFGIINSAKLVNIRLKDIRLVNVGENSGGLVSESVTDRYSLRILDPRDKFGIRNCSVTGSITASANNIGGLAGYMTGTRVNMSRADVKIVNSENNTGGFVGFTNLSTFDMCAALGKITVQGEVTGIGGFVGRIIQSNFSNSCSFVDISASPKAESVGGFLGLSTPAQLINKISNCFAVGRIRGGSKDIGGFIGTNENEELTVHSYWNTQTSGVSTSAGGEGRTTAEMAFPYSDNTYVGWDFDTVWRTAEKADINNGYPYHSISGPTGLLITTSIYTDDLWRYNELTWETDRNAKAYRIYRDDLYLTTVHKPEGLWKDEDVDLYETYTYYITAVYRINGKDVESDKSNTQTTKPIRR